MNSDSLHKQSLQTQKVEKILYEHMCLYGYQLIDLPLMDDADLFLTRAGDKIIEKLFIFQRMGHQLALRPEFTAIAAHNYIRSNMDGIVRWQFRGPIFADDPTDHSLQYQRQSIGAECIGFDDNFTETDMIVMAVEGARKIGLLGYTLVCGHVGLQRQVLSRFGLDMRTQRLLLAQRELLREDDGRKRAQEVIDWVLSNGIERSEDEDLFSSSKDIDLTNQNQASHILDILLASSRYSTTMGGRNRAEIAERILSKNERRIQRSQITDALDFLYEWVNIRAPFPDALQQIEVLVHNDDERKIYDQWHATIRNLEAYGFDLEEVVIQPDLTKDWEYYTGMVFGIQAGDVYIAGGGRYDELARLLGGQKNIPAVGFAYYMDRLIPFLNSDIQPDTASLYLYFETSDSDQGLKWVSLLRNRGIAVILGNKNGHPQGRIHGDTVEFAGKHYAPDMLDELIEQLVVV